MRIWAIILKIHLYNYFPVLLHGNKQSYRVTRETKNNTSPCWDEVTKLLRQRFVEIQINYKLCKGYFCELVAAEEHEVVAVDACAVRQFRYAARRASEAVSRRSLLAAM